MIRWGLVAAMALGPVLAMTGLLARAQQSWQTCLDGTSPGFWPVLGGEALALASPIGIIVLVPFLALALIWAYRPHRRRTLVVWAGLSALILLPLCFPDAWHDCDRKGADGGLMFLVAGVLGLIACWIALWRNEAPT